ncbi:MAG: thiamine pyrophosphate-dependent dehydrogenase E1 component subunit alpha [Spirochaetales bacterium]|nr:thiamine pyrophosphate-dependent dehydrogenase E1 component subunit alpha [Spirochaetales bacterium]
MVTISREDKIGLYRQLVLNRIFEEKTIELYRLEGIPELPHSNLGEEAIGVGSCYGLNADDYVVPDLRIRPALITKGVPLNEICADMYGRLGGTTNGRATSHHMGYPSLGVVGTSGIIGGHLTISAGFGMASKIRKDKRVTLCFFGDGGSNRGDFHTSINFASLKKLPVLYIISNNQYAEGMPVESHISIKDIADRAAGYSMPGKVIDGNDVLEVYREVQDSVERARNGEGPTLIECKTFRLRPHCEAHPETRSQEELDEAWKHDPVPRMEKHLLHEKILTESEMGDIRKEYTRQVDEAFEFGKSAPYPPVEELYNSVYDGEAEWVRS